MIVRNLKCLKPQQRMTIVETWKFDRSVTKDITPYTNRETLVHAAYRGIFACTFAYHDVYSMVSSIHLSKYWGLSLSRESIKIAGRKKDESASYNIFILSILQFNQYLDVQSSRTGKRWGYHLTWVKHQNFTARKRMWWVCIMVIFAWTSTNCSNFPVSS